MMVPRFLAPHAGAFLLVVFPVCPNPRNGGTVLARCLFFSGKKRKTP